MLSRRQRGLSLVEMAVGVAILGILAGMGASNFSYLLQSMRIRTAAKSLQSGLLQARALAVSRNAQVRFQLIDTTTAMCSVSTGGPHWVISLDDVTGRCDATPSDTVAPRIIEMQTAAQGLSDATFSADQGLFVFNGLGRLTPTPSGNLSIDVGSATGGTCAAQGGSVPCLRVVVSAAGQVRTCDPAVAGADIRGC